MIACVGGGSPKQFSCGERAHRASQHVAKNQRAPPATFNLSLSSSVLGVSASSLQLLNFGLCLHPPWISEQELIGFSGCFFDALTVSIFSSRQSQHVRAPNVFTTEIGFCLAKQLQSFGAAEVSQAWFAVEQWPKMTGTRVRLCSL